MGDSLGAPESAIGNIAPTQAKATPTVEFHAPTKVGVPENFSLDTQFPSKTDEQSADMPQSLKPPPDYRKLLNLPPGESSGETGGSTHVTDSTPVDLAAMNKETFDQAVQLRKDIEEAKEKVSGAEKAQLDQVLAQLPGMSLQQHENQTEESLHAEKSEKKSFFAKIRTWLFAFLAAIGLPVGMSLKNASTELTGGQGQGQMQ